MTNIIPPIFCMFMLSLNINQLKMAVNTGMRLLYMLALAAPNLLKAKAHSAYATELAKIPNDINGTMYDPTFPISEGVTLSMIITIGMKYIMPMTFCTKVIVNGLYNNVNFLKEME